MLRLVANFTQVQKSKNRSRNGELNSTEIVSFVFSGELQLEDLVELLKRILDDESSISLKMTCSSVKVIFSIHIKMSRLELR